MLMPTVDADEEGSNGISGFFFCCCEAMENFLLHSLASLINCCRTFRNSGGSDFDFEWPSVALLPLPGVVWTVDGGFCSWSMHSIRCSFALLWIFANVLGLGTESVRVESLTIIAGELSW